MSIENGDFVRVNFTGKIKGTDEVFDTTYEEVAMEAGIYDENRAYKSIPVIIGGNHLLPAIEDSIIGLEVGDSKVIDVESADTFGPRDSKKIQIIPMREFKKQGMTPVPGMRISAEGGEGKILTVNGGRVKVDFNHVLAGRDVVYDVEIIEKIEGVEDKIKSIIEFRYPVRGLDLDLTEIDVDDGVLNIKFNETAKFVQMSYIDISIKRYEISRDIWDNIEEINKVNFIDSFEKKEENEEEESEEE